MAGKKQKWTFEPTQRHVRVKFGGEYIADSKNAMLMIEYPYELHYYFPKADVHMAYLTPSGNTSHSGYRGDAQLMTVQVEDQIADDAAWTYPETKEPRPDLSDYVAFVWKKMDAWYEEDEEVFLHPRNPYHRVDTIKSKRHIKVMANGETIAETNAPYLLFETGLPVRYYIPQEDVNMTYLTPTETHSTCPYKGIANYWTIKAGDEVFKDVVWSYPDPIEESPKIKGLMAFYNEKLDIYVDGELEVKPRTVFA